MYKRQPPAQPAPSTVRRPRLGLAWQIVIGLALGILAGLVLNLSLIHI
ncbi:hypothetical protein [Burkholderia gladioli]|nr:hypothetical protein [Burkholderia gladioli]